MAPHPLGKTSLRCGSFNESQNKFPSDLWILPAAQSALDSTWVVFPAHVGATKEACHGWN